MAGPSTIVPSEGATTVQVVSCSWLYALADSVGELLSGVYVFGGSGRMESCEIQDNGGDGVGVAEGAIVELQSCVVTGNGESGLQIYHPESRVKMAKCRIRDNTAAAVSFGEGATAAQVEAPAKQLRLLGLDGIHQSQMHDDDR